GRKREQVPEQDLVSSGVALDRVEQARVEERSRALEPLGSSRVCGRVLVAVDEHPEAEQELVPRSPVDVHGDVRRGRRQPLRLYVLCANGRTHYSENTER